MSNPQPDSLNPPSDHKNSASPPLAKLRKIPMFPVRQKTNSEGVDSKLGNGDSITIEPSALRLSQIRTRPVPSPLDLGFSKAISMNNKGKDGTDSRPKSSSASQHAAISLEQVYFLCWRYLEVESLGVNWGTMAINKLHPKDVVQLLKDNGINKVKLFDTDDSTMSALAGSDIEVMVAIPNDQLETMGSYDRVKHWVSRNVTSYLFKGGVTINGNTAVVVIKQGTDLVIANLGDSRAVLGTKTDKGIVAIQLTTDLKPGVPSEAERIRKCNGRVLALIEKPHIQRVWLPYQDSPGLAMSRAFGDFVLKTHGVIAIPDISYHQLSPNDQFLVLASDGVWDVLNNDQVMDIVSSAVNEESAAREVVDAAISTWKQKFPNSKRDDCTVICHFLQP